MEDMYDLELFDNLARGERPWNKPGADISDFFNYGFSEQTWKVYCRKQRKKRLKHSMQSTIGTYEAGQASLPAELPQELRAHMAGGQGHADAWPDHRRRPTATDAAVLLGGGGDGGAPPPHMPPGPPPGFPTGPPPGFPFSGAGGPPVRSPPLFSLSLACTLSDTQLSHAHSLIHTLSHTLSLCSSLFLSLPLTLSHTLKIHLYVCVSLFLLSRCLSRSPLTHTLSLCTVTDGGRSARGTVRRPWRPTQRRAGAARQRFAAQGALFTRQRRR